MLCIFICLLSATKFPVATLYSVRVRTSGKRASTCRHIEGLDDFNGSGIPVGPQNSRLVYCQATNGCWSVQPPGWPWTSHPGRPYDQPSQTWFLMSQLPLRVASINPELRPLVAFPAFESTCLCLKTTNHDPVIAICEWWHRVASDSSKHLPWKLPKIHLFCEWWVWMIENEGFGRDNSVCRNWISQLFRQILH